MRRTLPGAAVASLAAIVLGTVASPAAAIGPPPCAAAPSIEAQPTSQAVTAPNEATFTAAGSTPANCGAPTVQWYSEAPGAPSYSPIGGATSASYKTPATTTVQSGTKYEATFKNSFGETTTTPATLTIEPPVEPPVEPPSLRIVSPLAGFVTNSQTPVFSGTTTYYEGISPAEGVRLNIYRGAPVDGKPVGKPLLEKTTSSFLLNTWSIQPAAPLEPGAYTAQAEQTYEGARGESEPVAFTIDTTSPHVTITSPANGSSTISGSQAVGGSAGIATGDLPTVMVDLFAGATAPGGTPLETLAVQASEKGSWSGTFGGLAPGTYTALAEQRDKAGNVGTSEPVTFTVARPPVPPPPLASFTWFPPSPQAGESVSLVSSSTDSASPITAFGWALLGNGAFVGGGPMLVTSFANPGGHVVRLRVTDANGLTSVATQTIIVRPRALVVMQPFPIVRIAGSGTRAGVRLALLTVQAPVGATVSVTCRGHGCGSRSESRFAASSTSRAGTGAVLLAFRRFERSLPAGVVLTIRVSRPGDIGKYTSFAIRRGKPPTRVDACLWPNQTKPIPCPAS